MFVGKANETVQREHVVWEALKDRTLENTSS